MYNLALAQCVWLRHSFVIDRSFVPQRRQEQFHDEIEAKRSLARHSRQRPSRLVRTRRAAGACVNMPHKNYAFFFFWLAETPSEWATGPRANKTLSGQSRCSIHPAARPLYVSCAVSRCSDRKLSGLPDISGRFEPPDALSRRRTRVNFQLFLSALFRFDFLE